jgi:hypothetical protein
MGMETSAHRILVGKTEGKRPLGRSRHSLEGNIKMHPGEIGWGGMDWIDLNHDRDQWRALLNMVTNCQVPHNIGKFLCSCMTGGF